MNFKKFLIRICARAGVILKGRQCTKKLTSIVGEEGRRMKGKESAP